MSTRKAARENASTLPPSLRRTTAGRLRHGARSRRDGTKQSGENTVLRVTDCVADFIYAYNVNCLQRFY